MARRRAVRMIRHAISPRLAIRILLNIEAIHYRTLSWPGLSRPSRLCWHDRAFPSEIAGTSPAMTSERVDSHPEDSELGLSDRRIEAGRNGQGQQAAGVGRIDDAVIPQARPGLVAMALAFVL